jgi:hypothetical protein
MDFDGKKPWVSVFRFSLQPSHWELVDFWSKEVVTIGPAFEGHNKRLGVSPVIVVGVTYGSQLLSNHLDQL